MDSTSDLILGAITDYSWEKIYPWVKSLEESGFDGKKAMICYNIKKDVIDELTNRNFSVFGFAQNDRGDFQYHVRGFNIVVERFGHYWYFLNKIETPVRYVIATDVADVIFQRNPSTYINNTCGIRPEREWSDVDDQYGVKDRIIASGEGFKYQDEPWSKNNMAVAFGDYMLDHMKDKQIYCAGVIAGERKMFTDLSLQIFLMCRGTNHFVAGGGGPDQSAYNILLHNSAISKHTLYNTNENAWALQAGTCWDAIKSGSGDIGGEYVTGRKSKDEIFSKMSVHNMPYFNTVNGNLSNHAGESYCIVHQYNRVPKWKKMVEEKYAI